MLLPEWLCQRSLKYNLKAIHNISKIGEKVIFAVSKIVKIQFESNSQRDLRTDIESIGCVKDR